LKKFLGLKVKAGLGFGFFKKIKKNNSKFDFKNLKFERHLIFAFNAA
jgi:hypothetical protein